MSMFRRTTQVIFRRIFQRTSEDVNFDVNVSASLFFIGGFYYECNESLKKDNKYILSPIIFNLGVACFYGLGGGVLGLLYPAIIMVTPILSPPIIYDRLIRERPVFGTKLFNEITYK